MAFTRQACSTFAAVWTKRWPAYSYKQENLCFSNHKHAVFDFFGGKVLWLILKSHAWVWMDTWSSCHVLWWTSEIRERNWTYPAPSGMLNVALCKQPCIVDSVFMVWSFQTRGFRVMLSCDFCLPEVWKMQASSCCTACRENEVKQAFLGYNVRMSRKFTWHSQSYNWNIWVRL